MILERLYISRISYGHDEGQYKGEIQYVGKTGTVELKLDKEISGKLLLAAADAITAVTAHAAEHFRAATEKSVSEAKAGRLIECGLPQNPSNSNDSKQAS